MRLVWVCDVGVQSNGYRYIGADTNKVVYISKDNLYWKKLGEMKKVFEGMKK